MKWTIYLWESAPREGATELGRVEADGQPQALLVAGRRWPDVSIGSMIARAEGGTIPPPPAQYESPDPGAGDQ